MAQEEFSSQDFRRLKTKLINDTRINNPKKDGEDDKPFRTEFVKSQEDMNAYLDAKKADPVQQAYDESP